MTLPFLHADVHIHTHGFEAMIPLAAAAAVVSIAGLVALFVIRSRKA